MLRSIRFRLALLLLIPMFFFVLTAVMQLNTNSSNIGKMKNTLYEASFKSNNLVVQADRDMYQALRAYDLLRLAGLPPQDYEQFQKDFQENATQFNERLTDAAVILKANSMTELIDPETNQTAGALLSSLQTEINQWVQQTSANIEGHTATDIEQEKELSTMFDSTRGKIDILSDIINQYAVDQTAEMQRTNDSSQTITWISLSIEWLAILVLGYLLIRYMGRSINKALSKTTLVAAGNLQAMPEAKYRKDELGRLNQAIDAMIGRMRDLVGHITDNTHTVSASSIELSIGAKESAASSTNVAEHIQAVTEQAEMQTTIAEESSRAVEEMAIGVQRIAENTNSIADLSTRASDQAELGNSHMQSLKEQMESIFQGIQSLSKTVAQLNDKSEKIGQITENITSFANQTNILSLNASIEAARAGEHGRGFAVVAQEIRKLAAGSLESAEVISALIEETRGEIAKASGFMSATLSQSSEGEAKLSEVGQDFTAILEAVKQVAVQVHETSAITQQMSASSEEVAASMEQSATAAREVSGKTQEVAAATEEQLALAENISHASEQLRGIVESLKQSVSQFRL
ncbi:methyl-accepting chemotaxis protein [Cohnella lubricantis]|uniref:HAMP domain-containing protein n=1 Tax=Cohnella lubricantis TaxID=2163172 RepID=A0A841TBZ1_9BACL|nr:methyl-accepting chemotaxis protein [Cohnella lubricantis]MBB6676527.1 HAMP domain-containing protein [Cohnella lubricantis]MBP2120519.1 methyl-accepting chemotaxis protein [Cohnella lubricantis]